MSLDLHRQAERLMAEADLAGVHGEASRAQHLFHRAAQLEADAFDAIPVDRVRTRAVIAVSVVVLYIRAREWDDARSRAFRYLSDQTTFGIAGSELLRLLEDINLERALADEGLRLEAGRYEWKLSGPGASSSGAELDLVVQKISQIDRAATRAFEYVSGLPLRMKGPPTASVQRGFQLLIGQPVAGSFRFDFRLARSPEQLTVFGEPDSDAHRDFSTFFSELMKSTSEPERLETLVDDVPYRLALARLVRNIAPDGKRLTEVAFVRLGETGPNRTTRLTKGIGKLIGQFVNDSRPHSPGDAEIVAKLRGLNLNTQQVFLGEGGSQTIHKVSPDIPLEDIAGPLINKQVRVKLTKRGRWHYVEDMEEAADVAASVSPTEPDQTLF